MWFHWSNVGGVMSRMVFLGGFFEGFCSYFEGNVAVIT